MTYYLSQGARAYRAGIAMRQDSLGTADAGGEVFSVPRSQTNKTAYTHSTASAVDHMRQTRFTLSIAEGG